MKNTIWVLAASAAMPCLAAVTEPLVSPESQGVESAAVERWIGACEKEFFRHSTGLVRGFVIRRHGKVVAEGTWRPFDTLNKPHALYSHSKSFTSSAIGLLVDDGKLDLDERVVAIFPEYAPENPSDDLKSMRVRDLLTMNTGMPKDQQLARSVGASENWIKAFLAKKIEWSPGTGFKYDSDATYVLSAIVERRAGKPLMDFLDERMFSKIGIENKMSDLSPDGIACGGWGMHMTTREISRFGQLLLDKGVWNGSRILTEDWIALATTRHTWSGWIKIGRKEVGAGTDWEQGYGFQFWRCHKGAYRADGANGQLTVVMPEQDAVVSINAGLDIMQKELDLVWNILLPAMHDAPLAEDAAALASLRARCAALAVAPPNAVFRNDDLRFLGKKFPLGYNFRGFKSIEFAAEDDGALVCLLETKSGVQRIRVGNGEWLASTVRLNGDGTWFVPGLAAEDEVAANGGWATEDRRTRDFFRVTLYQLRDVGRLEVDVIPPGGYNGDPGKFKVIGGLRGTARCDFTGTAE